jgi:hypothetical protein
MMQWRSQAYTAHDEEMQFEKTTCHRPEAVAGAEVYFVCNLQIRRLIFAAAYMNGRFSRCAAARIFAITRHFHRCERTQYKIRFHTLGSVLPSALQRQTRISASLNVCSDRCSILGSHPQRKSGFRPSCQNVHGAASVTIRPCCRSWFLSQSNFAIAAKAGLVRVFTVQNDALSGCFLDQP